MTNYIIKYSKRYWKEQDDMSEERAMVNPKTRIYLSGPMRGEPNNGFEKFDEYAKFYRTYGYEVISPAEMDRELPQPWVREDCLKRDIKVLVDGKVDELRMLPGWEKSEGAKLEKAVAEAIGLPVHLAPDIRYLNEKSNREGFPTAMELQMEANRTANEQFDARNVLTEPILGPLKQIVPPRIVKVDDRSSEFEVKDSGTRQEFDSGMVRDVTTDKIRWDLVFDGPLMQRLAEHLTKGAKKYEARNWMKASGEAEKERFRESAVRHFVLWFNDVRDEDHMAAVVFNLNGYEYVAAKLRDGYDLDERK